MRSFGQVWGINIPRIIFDNQFDNYLDNISDAVTRALLGGGQAYGHASSSFVNSFSDTKTRVIETFNEALKLYVSEFNITLSSTANVWKLRVAVQQECTRSNLHFQDIRLDKLDVYKASLSPNESKAILQELKGGRRVTNSEWKTSLPGDLGLLSDYFTKQPDKRAIHLVVDCTSAVVVPATGPPATEPRWSIDEEHQDIILQEVGEFLASSFERLRQFDSRRFLLPRYEPNPQHSEYRAISSLNIPSLLGKPSLLMHNLPRNGTGGVVDVQGFTNSLESGHQLGVIVGASGSGKSRTAIEILCCHFGFYFTCATGGTQHAFGSKDMQYMLESIKTRCSDPQKVVENDNYTKRFATRVVLTRVYILCYLLNSEIQLSPYEWTMMQFFRSSNDDIFMSVARMFRPLSAYDADILLIQYIQKLQKISGQRRFPLVVDEARQLLKTEHAFSSATEGVHGRSPPIHTAGSALYFVQSVSGHPLWLGVEPKDDGEFRGLAHDGDGRREAHHRRVRTFPIGTKCMRISVAIQLPISQDPKV